MQKYLSIRSVQKNQLNIRTPPMRSKTTFMSGLCPKKDRWIDPASPARSSRLLPSQLGVFGVTRKPRHSDKLPSTHHPRLRRATQGVADPGVRHFSTINSISHRLEREEENFPHKPSDAGDRGHSKPVYLLPSSVRKRDSGTCASATSQMFERQHSRGPRVSRIRCGGICLQF